MKNRLFIIAVLALFPLMASAKPQDPAGTSWDGALQGANISISAAGVKSAMQNDGLMNPGALLNFPYLVRVVISDTGGGSTSHSEVLLQFTQPPKALMGKAYADQPEVHRAQIGNLSSCEMQVGQYFGGHSCPTNFNNKGWTDLSGAVSMSPQVLIINDPNMANKAGGTFWFAFSEPQNNVPYDIIDIMHGRDTFGFGNISASMYAVTQAAPQPVQPPHGGRPPHGPHHGEPIQPTPVVPVQPPPAVIPPGIKAWTTGTASATGGYVVQRWNGTAWDKVIGGAREITVDGMGNPWVITDSGNIVAWDGTKWNPLPGKGKDIGAGGGRVFAIGPAPRPGGFNIVEWTANGWVEIPGGAVRITVDGSGIPWIVTDNGTIMKWGSTTWVQVPGAARDIGAGGSSVYIIGTNSTRGGYGVYRYNPARGWEPLPLGGVRIDADSTGYAWMVDSTGSIWRWSGVGWARVPGSATDIGVE